MIVRMTGIWVFLLGVGVGALVGCWISLPSSVPNTLELYNRHTYGPSDQDTAVLTPPPFSACDSPKENARSAQKTTRARPVELTEIPGEKKSPPPPK